MTKPVQSRLFFDIETSTNIGLFWQAGYKLNIPPSNIIQERAIICVAYKWGGKRKVEHLVWDEDQCDKLLLERFIPTMQSADEIVTHNGDRFDTPWIRTRCAKHGIPMAPDFVSIDTLKAARSKFKFNSNKLDYVAGYLELGSKRPETYQLWKSVVIDKDEVALQEMISYCRKDVVLLELVYNRLNQYLPAKASRADCISSCPECSSDNVQIQKHRVTAQGYKKIQFQCQDCGKYHTVATSRFDKERKL